MPFGVPTASTTTTATNNNNIDGLLWGTKWASTSITYSFTDSISDYESYYQNLSSHASGFQALNATQRTAARSWFQQFSSVSGLTFTELTGASDRDATMRMASSPHVESVGAAAYAYLPGNFVEGGDAWFGKTYVNAPAIGNFANFAFGHELGHALGLKHGHEADGIRNVAMNTDRDSSEFSIMTYRSHVNGSTNGPTNETWGFSQSLMMYDIAALQHLYGANFNSNSTNTVYTFSTTTGEMFINGVGQGLPGANRIFRTIWDGNGIDTYNFSNYTTNLSIDLTPGGWTDLNVGGNFQRAQLNWGSGGTVVYARAHIFNALQYQGDLRSLIENANGGSGNDAIVGNAANNVLNGNAGNDNINGGAGNDTINGGAGADTLNGGVGVDTLTYASSGAGVTINLATNTATGGHATGDIISNFENVTGSDYNDNLTGNAGDNQLFGSYGNDTINGGAGNDTIGGGAGADILNGGDGIDTVTYGGSNAAVIINLATNTASGGFATGDIISNFENVIGSIYNDTLTGNAGANILEGGQGNDNINGGAGNDTINGGAGADTLNGGDGIDILTYAGSNAGVTINLATNTASGGFAAGDIISNFENITGSVYNDMLLGSQGNNSLFGEAGNDNINGGGGNDMIGGGAGADTLNGGDGIDTVIYGGSNAGVTINLATNSATGGFATGDMISNFENVIGSLYNDTLTGNAGANVLEGGAGKDTLIGGGGNDKFVYSALNQSLLANYDVITDYGVGDQIDAPLQILAANLTTSVGTAASLSAAAISAVLTGGVFAANSARAFTISGMNGTFVALNNGVAGFEAGTDGIIYLQNFAVGAASPVAIV